MDLQQELYSLFVFFIEGSTVNYKELPQHMRPNVTSLLIYHKALAGLYSSPEIIPIWNKLTLKHVVEGSANNAVCNMVMGAIRSF